ncbi:MAG: hypothetical protein JSV63_02905 [Candidatus Aenigmatarchaeota archaeon]|nr:MAG: hypothetical protein JSV63_02905 [Candidatus Aenigmarchaeota archaeon]
MVASGQVSFTTGNIVKLILVVVVAITFVAFINSQSGGLQGILANACERYPDIFPFCAEEDVDTLNREVASHSASALVCAINSVSEGENLCTGLEFQGRVNYRYFEKEVSCLGCDQSKCEGDGTEQNPGECYKDVCKDIENCEVVSAILDTTRINSCKCTIRVPVESSVNCETVNADYRCTVNNFQLPQDTSKWEDWIPFFGDPQYLLYYENFPMEEDTWNFKADWKVFLAVGVLSALPWSKLAGKLGGSAVKSAVRELISKVFTKELVKEGTEAVVTKAVTVSMVQKTSKGILRDAAKKGIITKQEAMDAINRLSRKNVREAMDASFDNQWKSARILRAPDIANEYAENSVDEAVMRALGVREGITQLSSEAVQKLERDITKRSVEETLKYLSTFSMRKGFEDMVMKRISARGIPKALVKFGVASTTVWAASVADSMLQARFDEYDDEIVLKEPVATPQMMGLSALDEEGKAMPIVVNMPRAEGFGDKINSFHMASPCYLQEIVVRETTVKCGDFEITVKDDGSVDENCNDIEDAGGTVNICKIEGDNAGDFGSLEFIEETIDRGKELPFYFDTVYNTVTVLDEGKQYYPILEYEEGCVSTRVITDPLLPGDCGEDNVYYRYTLDEGGTGHWEWKSPGADFDDYTSVRPFVSKGAWETYLKLLSLDGKIDNVHMDIMNAFHTSQSFEESMAELKNIIETGTDSTGGDTSDDSVIAYFYKEGKNEIKSDEISELLSLQPSDSSMEPPYYTIPISQGAIVYYKGEPETIKIGKFVGGELVELYDVLFKETETREWGDSTTDIFEYGVRIYEPEVYELYTNYLKKIAVVDAVSGVLDEIRFDFENSDDITADLSETPEGERKITLESGSNKRIELSDEGSDGVMKSVKFLPRNSVWGDLRGYNPMKMFVDTDPSEEGFEYAYLDDCVRDAIIVDIQGGMKTEESPNYCTAGVSKTGAWVELAGDALMFSLTAGGIIAGFYSGGVTWGITAAFIVGATAEVGSEFIEERDIEWPDSW